MQQRALPRAWAIACVAAAISFGSPALAPAQQSATGTLTGTVVDSTGASVPGATASAIEATTGATRVGITNEEGLFRIPALPPGEYSLRVELDGFRPVTVTDILLVSTEVREVGTLTLELGGQTEEVTVRAEVTPVQTRSSSRYSTVTSDQLTNIQMKGRDIYGLMAILPGVQDSNLNRDFTTWTSMRGVTINGATAVNKNIVVDGVSVVDEGGSGNAFVNPNIDAVGEVQVIANGFTAENGRNNGGLITMTVKSGTSQLRGSGWYNAKRDQWNANDYFRKRQGLPKPLYRVNISGYGVGGPVVIPGLFDSRTSDRKLFFFGSQEYTDDARPSQVVRANLPTEAERRGDFSNTRLPDGSIQPIIDPLTGQPFPGNSIPAGRINPVGQSLLNLLPMPNGITSPIPGEEFTSNSAYDETPLHSRTNHVLRIDAVLSETLRGSFTFMRDREDNWRGSDFAPGLGWVNNFVPGWIYSGKLTHVLSSTMVNEITVGFGHNNYGFKGDYDYTQYYCANLGVCPPRLEPFGPYQDPPAVSKAQADEYPYVPQLSFSGGNRSGLASYSPGTAGGRVLPAANRNDRWSFQDDLSITRGSHNFKFGFYGEYTLKTEPGSVDYMGDFDFGHDPTNPLSTGNGYANALLGIYSSYTELSNRVDSDRRHWQIEGYLQDSWRVTPRFTLDYGVRLTHSGPFYEANNSNSGFFDGLYDPALAPRLYRPVCLDGRPGNQPCPQELRGASDPADPDEILSYALVGTIVPGSGVQTNGMRAGGLEGKKPGQYFDFPYLVAAPRVGFAWDLTGDGQTALRASAGVFYNYPRGVDRNLAFPGLTNTYAFIGDPPVAFNRVIRNGTIDDVADAATAGVELVENPINASLAGGDRDLETAYNVNVAFQRDVGFDTTVEVAYVGNFTRHSARNVDLNRIPLYAYGDVNNLFNNQAIDEDFLRTRYPGMGEVAQTITDMESVRYNALQVGVQRRFSQGLQFGIAYTLSKGEGMRGYDPYTEELGGAEALRERYWGPTDVDRRHNLVVNYSYLIPNPAPRTPVLRVLLDDWLVAGVTKFLSGTAVNPECTSNNSGIANSDPSLTGVEARCILTGEPIHSGFVQDPDPAVALRFNPNALAMAQPFSPTVGNFGNAPFGLLRNPSWSNWDITLERRFPLPFLSPNANVRLQLQAYNVFNQVAFTELDAEFEFTGLNNSILNSTTTGRYVATTPPRQLGLTLRVDF